MILALRSKISHAAIYVATVLGADAYLLEDGDYLLLEDGDRILLE
jgi:hypothetical protein